MKKCYHIISVFAMAAMAFMSSCEADTDTNEKQRESIVKYLEGTHQPSLIAETEVASSLDVDPAFYTVFPGFAYRYISTYYDADRNLKAEVKSGSAITLTFEMYPFTGSAISNTTLPVYTNNPLYEAALIEAGLNTELWDFTPTTFKMGDGSLLSSIQSALVGCREGDVVEVYLTFNMAYKNEIIGVIEKESAMLFRCNIVGVEN